MTDVGDPQSAVAAAEQAAAAGDYAAAEGFLRQAATLQEASLGPLHPDLANTLNNLGVVCEITQKPDDAEHFFRRAYAIATRVLEPGHPFVATSRQNLEDFCRTRGRPVDVPADGSVAVEQTVDPTDVNDFPRERQSDEATQPVESKPATQPTIPTPESGAASVHRGSEAGSWPEKPESAPGPSRSITWAVAAVVLVVTFAAVMWFSMRTRSEPPAKAPAAQPPAERPPAQASTPPPTADNLPDEPITGNAPPKVPADPVASNGESSALAPSESATSGTAAPAIVTTQLCRDLGTRSSEWRCVAPDRPVAPGVLFFYTRVKSPTKTTIQHRWYRGDRLRQSVNLTVRANTTAGYRTYSRQTVDSRAAGDWRVELRSRDGVLLHEERFAVQ